MTTQPPQVETLTELKLTDAIKQIVNEAYIPNDRPVLLSYVDANGQPSVSYRGSVIPIGDDKLGVWARNPDAGLPRAVPSNPNVVLIYREGGGPGAFSRAVLTFKGRARLAANEAERRHVYDTMVQRERDMDKDYKGVAIIVELDSVTGAMPGYRLQMRRE